MVFRTAERGGVTTFFRVFVFDIRGGAFDEIERERVAGFVVIGPGNKAVLAHHDGADIGLLAGNFLHGEAEFKARAHPGDIGHFAVENFVGQLFAVGRSGDRDDGVRVHVVNMHAGQIGMQGRVDRRGAGIQVKRAM